MNEKNINKTTGSKKIETVSKLPPITVSKEAWEEQLKRTCTNVTLRPTRVQAEKLVWLDLMCNIPKATITKVCLDRALDSVFDETISRLQGWSSRES
jgi:hypothetical protein